MKTTKQVELTKESIAAIEKFLNLVNEIKSTDFEKLTDLEKVNLQRKTFNYSSKDEELLPGDYTLEIYSTIDNEKFTYTVYVNGNVIDVEKLKNGLKTFLMW